MAATTSVPPQYAGLVDDAALFPPREASLEEAVAEHRAARGAPYAGLVGPFVVDDRRLPALLDLVGVGGDQPPLAVTVVVTGGAGAVEPVVRRAAATGPAAPVELTGVEVALRDLDDLTGNARRVVAALRAAEQVAPGVTGHVELPLGHVAEPARSYDWLAALDEVAAAGRRLKLRTGGLDDRAFPASQTLAAAVDAALDRELPFKCTAGLHHAVRHRSPETGRVHHGFLNVLLATAAAWDGAGHQDVAAMLDERDPAVVAAAARAAEERLTSARRWFTSFGCCEVSDPLADLLALGLLPRVP